MFTLPEEDVEYLTMKKLAFELCEEAVPGGGIRKAVLFRQLPFSSGLVAVNGEAIRACDLLILIPEGYATTRLDSFYTAPRLHVPGGGNPLQAAGDQVLFERKWQFWSRHLQEGEWRDGTDGLSTYLPMVLSELAKAA